MSTVSLHLRDGDEHLDRVDLARLTPAAAALARIIADRPLRTRGPLVLESVETIGALRDREVEAGRMSEDEARLWWDDAQDERHTVTWAHWSSYPERSTMDPHRYLEEQARHLPIGYRVRGTSGDDLLSSSQVLDLLAQGGRPIVATTWRAYVARGEAPAPDRHVAGRPLWRIEDIETWMTQRRSSRA